MGDFWWGQTLSDIITPLLDREYMVGVKEKLSLIHEYSKTP